MKNLIGKKVRGFKFESRKGCRYVSELDSLINQVGVIDDYNDVCNVFLVSFQNTKAYYPADLIEQHLVYHDLTEKSEPYTDAIKEAIIKAYFNGTSLPQIRESIRQAYTAIEAGVNAQLVEIKEERGKL